MLTKTERKVIQSADWNGHILVTDENRKTLNALSQRDLIVFRSDALAAVTYGGELAVSGK